MGPKKCACFLFVYFVRKLLLERDNIGAQEPFEAPKLGVDMNWVSLGRPGVYCFRRSGTDGCLPLGIRV